MSGAMVPLERIKPNPANVREDLGDLTELAASIRARGVLQPLVVAPRGPSGWFVVIDGHRRRAAAELAGLRAVPCLATKAGDESRDIALMLSAAMHKELTPVERGRAFLRLRRRGLTLSEIARQTGYAPSTVSKGLLIAELPADTQDLVQEGQVTATAAVELARQVRAHGAGTATVGTVRAKWFAPTHRLALVVRNSCGHAEFRQIVGAVGCGQCWEDAIRFDERDRQAKRSTR
jgi:ParB family chromosome partitioning protein